MGAESLSDIGFSSMAPIDDRQSELQWRMEQMRDDGTGPHKITVPLRTKDATCPVVTPIPPESGTFAVVESDAGVLSGDVGARDGGVKSPTGGYAIAWRTSDGLFFMPFDLEQKAANTNFVAGGVRFGLESEQPKLAALASVGRDFALAFARKGTPGVMRLDVYGNLKGGTLLLPTDTGAAGDVAAVPGNNAVYVTYQEEAPSASSAALGGQELPQDGTRPQHFVKVECD